MTRILMRSVMAQLDNPSAIEIISDNLVGDNIGNMIFAYSMQKTVMTCDSTIDTIATNKQFTEKEIAYFNENYDYFVIPLANAFRVSFRKELKYLTHLVKNLKIPCVVAGVGMQTNVKDKIDHSFLFDEESKEFVKAVLEKSAKIGVRGETTAKYLRHLGFTEEKDFTVIGCPSMYMYGEDLPQMEVNPLTKDSVVSINRKLDLPKKLHEFLEKCMREIPNYTFIPQGIADLRLLYMGKSIDDIADEKKRMSYPQHLNHEELLNDKAMSFVNVQSWLNFLGSVDFSYGSRIHGNIAAILAGTPCYIFAPDSRVKELAEYHNIPFMLAKDIKSDTDLLSIHEQTDFSKIHKGHVERFHHFVDFLNENQLPHIYSDNYYAERSVFEERMQELDLCGPIRAFSAVSLEEQMHRLNEIQKYYQQKNKKLIKENEKLIKENEKLAQKHEKLLNESELQLAKRLIKKVIGR